MRPRDGLSNANNEDEYTASTPVDTKEFMSGDNLISDDSPDRIRLAPGTASQTMDQKRDGGWGYEGTAAAFVQRGHICEVIIVHVSRSLAVRESMDQCNRVERGKAKLNQSINQRTKIRRGSLEHCWPRVHLTALGIRHIQNPRQVRWYGRICLCSR